MVPDVFGCQPRHTHPEIIDVALVARLHLIANPKLLEEAFDYNLRNTQCV